MFIDGLLITQPPANTLMVDTGPLSAGVYSVSVILHGNQGYETTFQIRNAANDTTLNSHTLSCVLAYQQMDIDLEISSGCRLRVVTKTDLSASPGAECQAAIVLRQKEEGIAFRSSYTT